MIKKDDKTEILRLIEEVAEDPEMSKDTALLKVLLELREAVEGDGKFGAILPRKLGGAITEYVQQHHFKAPEQLLKLMKLVPRAKDIYVFSL